MCGITGFIDFSRRAGADVLNRVVGAMTDTLHHRGPDSDGSWCDQEVGVTLGHRRLAIIDLAHTGHQPMVSANARYVISYNGEIYNYRDLAVELSGEGVEFRGRSDTEVILEGCSVWGHQRTLERLNGMFAYSLWDRESRTLTLARDRLGEKPLYYAWMGENFLFASELKALKAHPSFRGEIDRHALAEFLQFGYVPTPRTIYAGVHKLPPGATLTVMGDRQSRPCRPCRYWCAETIVRQALDDPFPGDEQAALDELQRLLLDAVGIRMISDVPLGALLSGGIDSSTIVALMQAQSERPVDTFSIGFEEAGYNEAKHAQAVSRHLGTNHHELYVSPRDAREVIPSLPRLYDEPFADASQIPTYLLSRMARTDVTVSLSGDGGDELFGGYNRHFWVPTLWNWAGRVPAGLRRGLARGVRSLAPRHWDRMFRSAGLLLPATVKQRTPGDKMHKLAGVLEAADTQEIYMRLTSIWPDAANVVRHNRMASSRPCVADGIEFGGAAERMMFFDMTTYLPDDLLVKVDRASMAVSLEVRVPLLDPRVVEFAWRLPLSMKVRGRTGKWLLRKLLYRYVPRELVDRPKMGFAVPIGDWLRGPLHEWAQSLLDPVILKRQDFFNVEPIERVWKEHQCARRNNQYQLWNVLMFQAWLAAETSAGDLAH